MKRVVISAALAALGAGLLASAADAPEPVRAPVTDPGSISTALLPADPARALVIRTCVVCHPAELVIAKKRTVETWDRLISKMVDYGARADDDQQVEILTYFASYFLGTDTSIGAPAPVKAEPQR